MYIYRSKGFRTPTHSRVFLYFDYFLHCRIIVKTSELWNNTWNHVVIKKVLNNSKYIKLATLCTLLAFSQPASWGSHLECISIMEFLSFLMHLSQSVVLWQGMVGIQKIALFDKRPSPYYGKDSSNKQRETTVHHYFKTWWSVNTEHFKNFESFFKCSHKNHQELWWNCLSWGLPQEL